MGAARRSTGVAIALVACACVSDASPVASPCTAQAERAPLPSLECFESDDGQRHAARVASAIGDTLTGYRSHPGSAALSVDFDGAASVASVCAASVEGEEIARRLPRTAARLRRLPAGPACFAGRRLDFAWESAEVTSEALRQATRECRRRIEGLRRRNLFCLEMQRCSEREVVERWDRGDRELRSCVLEKLPLEMTLAGSVEPHPFVPVAGSAPDPDLATQALQVCEALADRDTLIDCMRRHGWVPRQ